MRRLLRSIRQFLSELRHRNVYQVALAYLAAGFVVVELADIAAGTFDLPGWFGPMVWVLVGLGFPIALVLAWALEVTPEGVRVEEAEGSEETAPAPSRSPRDLWVGASVLALVLLGAWWMWGGLGGGDGTDPTESRRSEIEDRSIAVLPFEVSGAGAEEWRDGMVTMLSTGLDGAGGLRAIPDRTVFARWEEASEAEEGATTEEALSVARRTGARYAVVGSAGVLGNELRFSANVYEVSSGKRLGQALVRGSPDSITSLTDQLTRDVLGILLEKSEEQIPSVDLASITTESLEALKAYLAGERHLRAGEYEGAVEDYERAVQQDSTFALAYVRLARSRVWLSQPSLWFWKRAYGLRGRLPVRERHLVWAHYRAIRGRGFVAADSLRRWTDLYPDDPGLWYEIGEALWHGFVPGGWPEAERAFQRAVELDPGVAPYHNHLVDLAFSLHRDSALAARRITAHPGGRYKDMFEAVWDVKFGPPSRRTSALAHLDEVWSWRIESQFGNIVYSRWPLSHPADLNLQARALRAIEDHMEPVAHSLALALNYFQRGQIEKALARVRKAPESGESAGCLLAMSLSLGYPLPDSTLHSHLGPSRIEEDASPRRLLCTGLSLVEQGRSRELPALTRRLQAAGAERGMPEAEIQRLADEVKGYQALLDGDLKRAEKLLGGHNESWYWGAIWRGDLYRKLGRLQKAEEWYVAGWQHPVAHERLGQLYEEMDKPEKAAEAYERFIAAWKDAGPGLQDRVTKARERLDALGAEGPAE